MNENDIELFGPGCTYHLLELVSLVSAGTLAGIHEFFYYHPI